MTEKHPQVLGFLDDHPGTTRILCPFCGCLHTHGRSPGNRIPHCRDRKDLSEYCIILVDVSTPAEAIKIDRQAHRLHKILQGRRCSPGRNKPNKADFEYEREITALAESAREINRKVIEGVKK